METKTDGGGVAMLASRGAYLEAAMRRDPAHDGSFVFGVTSTDIYCRPSCPARRPKSENIVFFADPSAAEAAGFRACRRCMPKGPSLQTRHAELVRQVCEYIQTNLEKKLTLLSIGIRFRTSPYQVQRTFKQVMGVSPRAYAEECRIRRLKTQLRNGDTVSSAVYRTGYGSQSWLYHDSTVKLGMTPATYRRGGEGMDIGYFVGSCPLGRLLVAATEHGICTLNVGDDDQDLIESLKEEYPNATIRRSEEAMELFEGVMKFFSGQQLSLPLDVRGTDFQRRVWRALQVIPYGETCSYGDVAEMLGDRASVRAVANACAANPVPLIIPCHRVVRKDGSLGGYRLGVERKRSLLEHERPRSSGVNRPRRQQQRRP
jgi:AraC family transcriptional regulator, regulatory protein of adaptative response / methylated-DNA-[protein]-cysteine methyltransferase